MPNLTDLLTRKIERGPTPKDLVVAEKYDGSDTLIAALSYVYFVSGAILLLRNDNSEFVRFHAKQSFLLLLLALLSFLLAPGIWKWVLNSLILLVLVYGGWRASQGRRWTIPYFTSIANSIDV